MQFIIFGEYLVYTINIFCEFIIPLSPSSFVFIDVLSSVTVLPLVLLTSLMFLVVSWVREELGFPCGGSNELNRVASITDGFLLFLFATNVSNK